MVKSQILAGGRGLGTFKNGFKGGVHIVKVDDAEETAKKMLGQVLVTKQTGPGGKPVGTLFIASKMDLAKEMYFAILNDRASAQVMMIGCGEGRITLASFLPLHKSNFWECHQPICGVCMVCWEAAVARVVMHTRSWHCTQLSKLYTSVVLPATGQMQMR